MKLVFYGAGNMAQAIFKGIINSKKLKSHDIYLTNKSNEEALKNFEELGVEYGYDDENLLQDADYVFLGSKPYDFEKVAQRIQPYINENNRFISIMVVYLSIIFRNNYMLKILSLELCLIQMHKLVIL